jgi:hypothetical protein
MTAAQQDRPADSRPDRSQASRRTALRGASMGASVMLIVQYALGIWVNLYVSVPAADKGAGFATAIGRALANGPAALAAHAALGLLLVVTGISALVRAILARHGAVIVTSAVGLVAIVGAGSGGAAFVGNGKDGASFAMALLTALAMLSYLVSLFILGRTLRPGEQTGN